MSGCEASAGGWRVKWGPSLGAEPVSRGLHRLQGSFLGILNRGRSSAGLRSGTGWGWDSWWWFCVSIALIS